ncbi:MAG: AmmeMemoRadiSam system protein B [Polyangiaceae bacterium]
MRAIDDAAAIVREPAVAGRFYPGARDALERAVDALLATAPREPAPREALGVVMPHAGYVYSGGVAARTISRIAVPARVVILSPNHTGRGEPLSIWPGGRWRTPLGMVDVDAALTDALAEACGLARETAAHRAEHGVEVELPFLQRLRPDVRIAAIVLATQDPAVVERVGIGLRQAIAALAPDALVLASSDMNHFESHERTLEKDRLALDSVLARDPAGLLETCARHDITMCGVAPTAAMLWAAEPRRDARAELVEHTTSGAVSGDMESVVGYAGVILHA